MNTFPKCYWGFSWIAPSFGWLGASAERRFVWRKREVERLGREKEKVVCVPLLEPFTERAAGKLENTQFERVHGQPFGGAKNRSKLKKNCMINAEPIEKEIMARQERTKKKEIVTRPIIACQRYPRRERRKFVISLSSDKVLQDHPTPLSPFLKNIRLVKTRGNSVNGCRTVHKQAFVLMTKKEGPVFQCRNAERGERY